MQDITPLESKVFGEALTTLERAFVNDPVYAWLFPDPRRRSLGVRLLHRVVLEYGVRHGRVMDSHQGKAVAIWITPGYGISAAGMIRCGILTVPYRVGLGRFARLAGAHAAMERFHREHMPEPHWQLLMLGVLPGWQRRGLGSALVEEGLDRAGQAGCPCYVETCDERNLPFYRRHGFRVLGSAPLGPGGPAGWAMRRDALRTG